MNYKKESIQDEIKRLEKIEGILPEHIKKRAVHHPCDCIHDKNQETIKEGGKIHPTGGYNPIPMIEDLKPKDYGEGGPKNNVQEDKHDMAELPLDLLAELLCPAYKEGTQHKYYRNSWRKGFKMSVMMAACLRHLTKFFYFGEVWDKETLEKYGIKKHHLGAAIFCIISLYNDWKNNPKNDDRPFTKFYDPK